MTATISVTKGEASISHESYYVKIYGNDKLLWEDTALNGLTKPYETELGKR